MGLVVSAERPRKITNLASYIFLTSVRQQTSLIGGKIFYNGREYTKAEYSSRFPPPVIEYEDKQLDGKQIKR